MLKEFKEFALKGNMIDLAVGVIIGGAFNSLVTSLVENIIMPILSLVTGKIDFSNLFIALDGNTYKTLAQAKSRCIYNQLRFICNWFIKLHHHGFCDFYDCESYE